MRSYTLMIKYGLPLTREHYIAIGQVAAIWQMVEITVQAAIWTTLSLSSDDGRLATTSLRFDTHLDIMSVLATKAAPDDATLIRSLISETKALQGERNTVVHAFWGFGPKDLIAPVAMKLRMKDAGKQPATFTPEQITEIGDRINAARDKWWNYIDKVLARDASEQRPEPQDQAPQSDPN